MGEMPRDLSEEAVAEWLRERQASWPVEIYPGTDRVSGGYFHREDVNVWLARAVLALVRAKVREAVVATTNRQEVCVPLSENTFTIRDETDDEVVARVMGEEVRRG